MALVPAGAGQSDLIVLAQGVFNPSCQHIRKTCAWICRAAKGVGYVFPCFDRLTASAMPPEITDR